jgi:hypothetical protein
VSEDATRRATPNAVKEEEEKEEKPTNLFKGLYFFLFSTLVLSR